MPGISLRYNILLWIPLLATTTALAQAPYAADTSAHRTYLIGAKIESGFIYTRQSALKPLSHDKPLLAQVDVSILDDSKTTWDHCNCYSKTGFTVTYINFNNPKLGRSYALSAFLEPYFFTTHKLQFSLRGAMGIAWMTNVYKATTNPDNLFYSSPVSFLLQANANLSYPLTPSLRLNISGNINHISNGGTRWPNYGINFFTAGAGLEYLIHPAKLIRRPHSQWDHDLKFSVHIFGARHPTEPAPGYQVVQRSLVGINAGVLKPLTRMNAIGVGGEVYYDPTATVYAQRTDTHYDPWLASVSIQHAFYLGRLFFGQQLAYTLTPLNPNVSQKLYERYFLECRITGKLYAGVSLKAYGGVSDHFALTTSILL